MTLLKAIQNITSPEQRSWMDEIDSCLYPEFNVVWHQIEAGNIENLLHQIQDETLQFLVCNLSALPINLPDKVKIVALSHRISNTEQIWCDPESIDMTMDFRMKENTSLYVEDIRQQYQILSLRPDLQLVISKDDAKAFISKDQPTDPSWVKIPLNPKEFVPAAGNGVVAIVAHQEDTASIQKLKKVHHSETALLTNIERKVLKLNTSEKLEILGVYCLQAADQNYQVFASAICDGQLLKTLISQSTNQGLAEKVLESFYQQIS